MWGTGLDGGHGLCGTVYLSGVERIRKWLTLFFGKEVLIWLWSLSSSNVCSFPMLALERSHIRKKKNERG